MSGPKSTGHLRKGAKPKSMDSLAVNGMFPKIQISWKTKAIEDTGRSHIDKRGNSIMKIFRINWKLLERNKFAPWGIGSQTCLYKG